ncbi:MAG: DUF3095 domain-containing protein, partial [Gammaproteobacteria bacterium]
MNQENIYSHLPILEDFSEVCDLGNYTPLPDDWSVIVADIANSTEAIQRGYYKAVNLTGVSIIAAVLNIADKEAIPYIFGGDGASLCVPPAIAARARQALIATREMAAQEFSLVLRIGMVPVHLVNQSGNKILVARHKVSKYCVQAAFAGGGIEYAEDLLKSGAAGIDRLQSQTDETPAANYTGLECRWADVPSKHGETISLIIKAILPTLQEQASFYREAIAEISRIYGDDRLCHPITVDGLRPSYNNFKLSMEASLKSYGHGKAAYLKLWLIIRLQNILGWIFMTFNMTVGGIEWKDYKPDLVANSDFKKFDGILREVISGTTEQRRMLVKYLEEQFQSGNCVYGIHYSESALVTCLVGSRSGNHFHFVDGADGGY